MDDNQLEHTPETEEVPKAAAEGGQSESAQGEPIQAEQPQGEPTQAEQPQSEPTQAEQPQGQPTQTEQYANYSYTDPNAGYGGGPQNYNQQYQNGQNNYQYNVENPRGYADAHSGMDESPMTMGDWLLTILALMIPCAGIVLYFVWAFGKSGNVNRRNYCRANLIVMGVVLALYFLFVVIFGLAMFTSSGY